MKIINETLTNLDNIDTIKELVKYTNDFVFNLYKNNQKKLIKNKSKCLTELKQSILSKNSNLLNEDINQTNTLITYLGDSIFIANLNRFNQISEQNIKLLSLYRYIIKLINLYDNGDQTTKNIIQESSEYVQQYHIKEHTVKSLKYNNSNFLYSFVFIVPELIFSSSKELIDNVSSWCHFVEKLDNLEQKDILKNSILEDIKRYFILQIDKYQENENIFNNLFHAFIKNISSIKTKSNSIYKKYNVKKFSINENANYSVKTLLNFLYFLNDYFQNLISNQ